FFDLGGDSIISIQLVIKATQQQVDLTPKQIFDHQTIAELATIIEMPDQNGDQVKQNHNDQHNNDAFTTSEFALAGLDDDQFDALADMLDSI
ncbi:MAG: phosphopantetheine-binding protein, partial [Chloroflexota bacterium]